jgi:hypothetical protein
MRQMRPGGHHHRYFDDNRSIITFFRGDYRMARVGLERCLDDVALIDVPSRISVPSDLFVTTRSQLAFALVMGGEVTAGLDQFAIAAAETEALPFPQRPFTQCFVAAMRGAIEIAIGDLEAAGHSADEMTELGERHGFTFWSMIGMLLRAMVDLEAGDPEAAARADTAITMLRALDVQVWQPSWLATLAAGHLRHGHPELAAAALDQAAEVADRTGARYWSAEIARLRHEVLLASGEPADLSILRDAAALAADQGAKLVELRSRTDLCRHSDDPADHEALAQLVGSLPEGLTLAEVAVAKTLLAQRG